MIETYGLGLDGIEEVVWVVVGGVGENLWIVGVFEDWCRQYGFE